MADLHRTVIEVVFLQNGTIHSQENHKYHLCNICKTLSPPVYYINRGKTVAVCRACIWDSVFLCQNRSSPFGSTVDVSGVFGISYTAADGRAAEYSHRFHLRTFVTWGNSEISCITSNLAQISPETPALVFDQASPPARILGLFCKSWWSTFPLQSWWSSTEKIHCRQEVTWSSGLCMHLRGNKDDAAGSFCIFDAVQGA